MHNLIKRTIVCLLASFLSISIGAMEKQETFVLGHTDEKQVDSPQRDFWLFDTNLVTLEARIVERLKEQGILDPEVGLHEFALKYGLEAHATAERGVREKLAAFWRIAVASNKIRLIVDSAFVLAGGYALYSIASDHQTAMLAYVLCAYVIYRITCCQNRGRQ